MKLNSVIFNASEKRKFMRFQLAALIATTVDFFMTIFFKEITGFHYSSAVASGATCGALTAFAMNRHWVFKAHEKHPGRQAIKYLIVATGSVILNTTGTFLLTEATGFPYLFAKAIIALIVGFTYSYYFSKRFVFNV